MPVRTTHAPSAVERLRKINELDSALSEARQQSDGVEEQLKSLQQQFSSAGRAHEEEVAGLNSRITTLSTAVTAANAQVEKLTNEVCRLEALYRDEVARSTEFADQQDRNVFRLARQSAEDRKNFSRAAKIRLANWELES